MDSQISAKTQGQQLGSVLLVTALAQHQLQHVVIVTVDLVLILGHLLGHLLLQELPVQIGRAHV